MKRTINGNRLIRTIVQIEKVFQQYVFELLFWMHFVIEIIIENMKKYTKYELKKKNTVSHSQLVHLYKYIKDVVAEDKQSNFW